MNGKMSHHCEISNRENAVFEAVVSRRTVYEFLPKPLSMEVIQKIVEAGTWAPNHRLTEPWRFVLVGEKTRTKLFEKLVELALAKSTVSQESIRESTRRKVLGQPVLIAVCCVRSEDPVRQQEDYAAVCAAIQNMQLVAWADGIGSQWITGKLMRLPETTQWLGVKEHDESVVGFLFLGYPAKIPKAAKRRDIQEVLRIVE
jgi:nitroreductase